MNIAIPSGCNVTHPVWESVAVQCGVDTTTTTTSPITSESDGDTVNVSISWVEPMDFEFISDPYATLETEVLIDITNPDLLDIYPLSECDSCFVWEIAEISDLSAFSDVDGQTFVTIDADAYSTEFQFISKFMNSEKDQISVRMVIGKLRHKLSGYCYDEEDAMTHIFTSNMSYAFRLKVALPRIEASGLGQTEVVTQSSTRTVQMNALPILKDGGFCTIKDLAKLVAADKFYLGCTGLSPHILSQRDVADAMFTKSMLVGTDRSENVGNFVAKLNN